MVVKNLCKLNFDKKLKVLKNSKIVCKLNANKYTHVRRKVAKIGLSIFCKILNILRENKNNGETVARNWKMH